MVPDPELDALIVGNIGELDSAARYLEQDLEPRIGAAIDDLFQAFMRKNDWEGLADWHKDQTWIASRDWGNLQGSAGEFKCKVWLEAGGGQGGVEDRFWLTYLLGAGVQSVGLRWYRSNVSKRIWRKAVSVQTSIVSALRARGFGYEEADGTFFSPIRIDKEELAAALRDETPEQALAPLEQALQKLLDAKPDFDTLLTKTAETSGE